MKAEDNELVRIGTFQTTGTNYTEMLNHARAVTAELLYGSGFDYIVTLEIISLSGTKFTGQVTIRGHSHERSFGLIGTASEYSDGEGEG